MSPSPIHIQPWEEFRGKLLELIEQESWLLAVIGTRQIVLPKTLKEKLQELEGKKIGILRTDLDFRLRNLEVEAHVSG
jgi:pyrimidine operon attenuation protein/uracil phosphoribosyltransferase